MAWLCQDEFFFIILGHLSNSSDLLPSVYDVHEALKLNGSGPGAESICCETFLVLE